MSWAGARAIGSGLQEALRREWNFVDLKIDLQALRQLTPGVEGRQAARDRRGVERARSDRRACWLPRRLVWHGGGCAARPRLPRTCAILHTGAVLATEATMNPQVTYGEDLMSRVSYAMMHDDGLQKMHTAIINALNQLAREQPRTQPIAVGDIYELVLVGNTVMHHILLGLDPTELGAAPFTLATPRAD